MRRWCLSLIVKIVVQWLLDLRFNSNLGEFIYLFFIMESLFSLYVRLVWFMNFFCFLSYWNLISVLIMNYIILSLNKIRLLKKKIEPYAGQLPSSSILFIFHQWVLDLLKAPRTWSWDCMSVQGLKYIV